MSGASPAAVSFHALRPRPTSKNMILRLSNASIQNQLTSSAVVPRTVSIVFFASFCTVETNSSKSLCIADHIFYSLIDLMAE